MWLTRALIADSNLALWFWWISRQLLHCYCRQNSLPELATKKRQFGRWFLHCRQFRQFCYNIKNQQKVWWCITKNYSRDIRKRNYWEKWNSTGLESASLNWKPGVLTITHTGLKLSNLSISYHPPSFCDHKRFYRRASRPVIIQFLRHFKKKQ